MAGLLINTGRGKRWLGLVWPWGFEVTTGSEVVAGVAQAAMGGWRRAANWSWGLRPGRPANRAVSRNVK